MQSSFMASWVITPLKFTTITQQGYTHNRSHQVQRSESPTEYHSQQPQHREPDQWNKKTKILIRKYYRLYEAHLMLTVIRI